ncbi:predicted protein [Lichtheimia corymbifera JMRC:FSU:9682]|nr:predicted protein [Lichtheimia corymbifera JMRC:FSU:9682]
MFARNSNAFTDYRQDSIKRSMSAEYMSKVAKLMEEVVFPAINERTQKVNKARKEKFVGVFRMARLVYCPNLCMATNYADETHKLVEFQPSPYIVECETKGGSYKLRDLDHAMEKRDYTPHEVKLAAIPLEELQERRYVVDRIVDLKTNKNTNIFTV